MNKSRDLILLATLALLGFALQLIATHWGVPGALAGGLLCGCTLWAGRKILGLNLETLWAEPLAAMLASALGISCNRILGAATIAAVAWLAPLFAFAPSGVPALAWAMRAKRCPLCRRSLRNTLGFACPRCSMHVCEYCWEFGRDRCHLCETNHIALLPAETVWWADRLGERRAYGTCSLCRTSAGGSHVPQWACGGCGQNQCVECWDDGNGVCSRCGWTLPEASDKLHTLAEWPSAPDKDKRYA